MIKLNVKVKGFSQRFTRRGRKMVSEAREGLRVVAQQAYEEWQDIAARKLNSTRRIYQDALHLKRGSGKSGAEITLWAKEPGNNWLVQSLEHGHGPFDMKPSRLSRSAGPGGITPRPAYNWSGLGSRSGKKNNPPFVDIPKDGGRRSGKAPKAYFRVSPKSSGFIHPGFKPLGGGGPGPMRHEVIEYIRAQIPVVLGPIVKKLGGSI